MGGIRLLANSCQARLAEQGGPSWSSTGSSPTVPERMIEWERTLLTAGSRTIGVGLSTVSSVLDWQTGSGSGSVLVWRRRGRRGGRGRHEVEVQGRERGSTGDMTGSVIITVVWYTTARYGPALLQSTQYGKRDVRKGEGETGREIKAHQVESS